MSRVKISVVKAFSTDEIFDGNVPEAVSKFGTGCLKHWTGQEYISENLDCPDGFCTWAFADIFRDLVQIAWEGGFPWITIPGVTFTSCTDGQKPVIFKLERLD